MVETKTHPHVFCRRGDLDESQSRLSGVVEKRKRAATVASREKKMDRTDAGEEEERVRKEERG